MFNIMINNTDFLENHSKTLLRSLGLRTRQAWNPTEPQDTTINVDFCKAVSSLKSLCVTAPVCLSLLPAMSLIIATRAMGWKTLLSKNSDNKSDVSFGATVITDLMSRLAV